MDIDTLRIIWFGLIAVLWTGYLVLEGFDFGVGMLLPVLGRDRHRASRPHQHHRPGLGRQRGLAAHRRRRDLRGVPAVVRHAVLRRSTCRCCSSWSPSSSAASPSSTAARSTTTAGGPAGTGRSSSARASPALLWGVAFGNIVHGVDVDHGAAGPVQRCSSRRSTRTASLVGLVAVGLFLLHGALFLGLKTTGDLRARAVRLAATLVRPGARRRRGVGDLDPARLRQGLDLGARRSSPPSRSSARCSRPGPGGRAWASLLTSVVTVMAVVLSSARSSRTCCTSPTRRTRSPSTTRRRPSTP